MSKRKRKNAVTLILLLFVLAGLVGLYFWYTKSSSNSDETMEKETIMLSSIDIDQVSSLHYRYLDTDLTLHKEKEGWVSEKDRSRPINQDRVNSILRVIDEISAIRIIAESKDKLEDYGLMNPTSYLQVTLTDGSRITLQIGNEVATGDGYYALVNEIDKVYQLELAYGAGLKFSDTDMTAVAEKLSIEASNIRHIRVEHRDREDFELLYQESSTLDNSGSTMFPWVITKPYTMSYPADSQAVETLQEKYTTFDYIRCVEYSPSDLSKYGLDQPMSVINLGYLEERVEKLEQPEKDPDTGEEIKEKIDYDPKDFQLTVGNLDENNNYYVMLQGDKAVYTMDKDAIDSMVEVDVFGLMSKFVLIPNIDMVEHIDLEIDGKGYTMSMKRTTAKNEAGDEEVKTTYYYNGKEVEEDSFRDVYQALISAGYDSIIKEEINTEDMKAYLSMTFYLNDEKKTVLTASYLPYDDRFYIIKNGETRFFADKRRIDDIVQTITELK